MKSQVEIHEDIENELQEINKKNEGVIEESGDEDASSDELNDKVDTQNPKPVLDKNVSSFDGFGLDTKFLS